MASRNGNTGFAYYLAVLLGHVVPMLLHMSRKQEEMFPWDYEKKKEEDNADHPSMFPQLRDQMAAAQDVADMMSSNFLCRRQFIFGSNRRADV